MFSTVKFNFIPKCFHDISDKILHYFFVYFNFFFIKSTCQSVTSNCQLSSAINQKQWTVFYLRKFAFGNKKKHTNWYLNSIILSLDLWRLYLHWWSNDQDIIQIHPFNKIIDKFEHDKDQQQFHTKIKIKQKKKQIWIRENNYPNTNPTSMMYFYPL